MKKYVECTKKYVENMKKYDENKKKKYVENIFITLHWVSEIGLPTFQAHHRYNCVV